MPCAGDGETAIALAGYLWGFWYRRGLFALGRELRGAALRLTTPDRSARALNGLASIHLALDDPAASLACHEEELALRRALNDPLGIATALHNLADTLWGSGERGRARRLAEASLHRFEALGDDHYVPDPRLLLAPIAADEGDLAAAHALAARPGRVRGPA